MRPLPSQEQEDANAAYVWLKQCLHDLHIAAKGSACESKTAEEVAWAYGRYKMAYEREQELSAKAQNK